MASAGPRFLSCLIRWVLWCDEFNLSSAGDIGDYFTWHYGIVSPAHMDFLSSQGFAPGPPASQWALAEMSAFRPPSLSLPRVQDNDNFPYDWPLTGDTEQDERAGTLLRQQLEEVALPQLDAWCDPRVLAGDMRLPLRRGFFPRLGVDRGRAVALLPAGPSPELRDALDQLEPGDMVRSWIESQLESRAGRPSLEA